MAATPATSSTPSSPLASPPPSLSSVYSVQANLPVSLEPTTRLNGTKADCVPTAPSSPLPDVDQQILEALRSKDRIYVLKLGELMEGLINDQRDRINLTPSTSYQRLLVHRCSAYYKLVPENDPTSKGITVCPSPESRIPPKRLCELVQLESIVQPAFKIMRRSQHDRKPYTYRSQSQTGSVAGEDADLSDVEPSESGSLGGRSNATGGSGKKRLTIEEREAAYNEARSRIFMDFEEKEKEKERNMSASSSSVSLVSGSASTSGGGSSVTGDFDELPSSPATESEYSAPLPHNKKGARQNTASSRPLRSSAPPFHGNPRNSRASSPPFTYANIYDPTQNQIYDLSQHPQHPGYHQPQYLYPYPPSGPPNPYYGGYPYYPPYNPYQTHHPPPQHSSSDPSTPSSGEPYLPPSYGAYHPHYGWSHPSLQSPPQTQHPPPQLPPHPHNPNHAGVPAPPPHNSQYPPYAPPPLPPPHAYTYQMPYYPPPPEQHTEPHLPHPSSNMYDVQKMNNSDMMGNQANAATTPTMSRSDIPSLFGNGRTLSNRHSGGLNGTGHDALPGANHDHSAWGYGPGVSQGGYTPGSGGADTVGPRLSSSRRQSGSGNGNSNRSSNDEVSSTASSSTTSSSSQRTYTSTNSSHHPLPPRPDWAVGMRPQAGIKTQARHHDYHNPYMMSPNSPSRSANGNSSINAPSHTSQQLAMDVLQSSTDFPPLTSIPTGPEKRTPAISGAWGRTSSNRSIRTLGSMQPGPVVSAHHPNHNSRVNQGIRLNETDGGFERPPPKSAELFNPKVLRRPTGAKPQEKEPGMGDLVINGAFIAQIESMTLASQFADSQAAVTPCN